MRAACSVVVRETGTGSEPVEDRRAGQQATDVDEADTAEPRQPVACQGNETIVSEAPITG